MLINESKQKHASNLKSSRSQTSSRRSRNALEKVSKMKKAYGGSMARSETLTSEQDWNSLNLTDDQTSTARQAHRAHNNQHHHHNARNQNDSFRVAEELNDQFEDEVSNLYMWTQNLSVNDDYVNTPRFPTA